MAQGQLAQLTHSYGLSWCLPTVDGDPDRRIGSRANGAASGNQGHGPAFRAEEPWLRRPFRLPGAGGGSMTAFSTFPFASRGPNWFARRLVAPREHSERSPAKRTASCAHVVGRSIRIAQGHTEASSRCERKRQRTVNSTAASEFSRFRKAIRS